jgi:endonuclease/exonuclease/phosphatase family metal-dependent hydrolase
MTMHLPKVGDTRLYDKSLALKGRRYGIFIALAACLWLGATPASGQVLSPSDPGFWVTLPDGGRVPYNHPLATGVKTPAPKPAPKPATPAPSPSAILTPSDPGFWVTLPDGGRVPYNHPAAIAAAAAGQPAAPAPKSATPASSPTAILTPSDPGFWVTLPDGGRVPYNHPAAIAAAAAAHPTAQAPQPAAPRPSAPQPAAPQADAPQPAAQPAAPAPEPAAASGAVKLRVLQWNLHHGVGTDGKYDIGRIASWMSKMKPDVIMLNEVEKNTSWGNEDQPARYEALMEQLTGRKWYALFSQEFGDWSADGKGHLILSTYPLEWTAREAISYDRVIGAAGITVNGRSLSLIVTHLDPDSQTRRLAQAKEVTAWSASLAENRILTGDMNAWPDQTSIAHLNTQYRDSWTDATNKGKLVQFSGLSPVGATKSGRIDYIYFSKGAANLGVLQAQVFDTRDANNVRPSDHRPVLTTFEVR